MGCGAAVEEIAKPGFYECVFEVGRDFGHGEFLYRTEEAAAKSSGAMELFF
jgi:hypothetical protein